jgi:hypothetical protein
MGRILKQVGRRSTRPPSAAKGDADRGTFLVKLKNGQTGYFTMDGFTESRLLG